MPEEHKRHKPAGKKGTDRRSASGYATPLISVITITYNAEKQIADTVRSVAEQSFRNYEHIIIDGASTDGTIAKVRMQGPKSLRVLSEPDDGLYDAMNKGIDMAQGKYLIFLNAGDTFHGSDTLTLYAEAAKSSPDIIYGDTIIVDADRNFLRPRHLQAPAVLTARSFLNGMLVCHQAFMVRRKIAPYYDLRYRFSADYDWCLRSIMASRPGCRYNLGRVTIDYLDDGLTEKNKIASLKERFSIMKHHFGLASAIIAHIGFIPRAVARKIRKAWH